MFDILIQIGASKLVVSAVLAGLAWLVQRRFAHPAVTHPLWLLVLVALLLPAVVSIPVLPVESGATRVIADGATLAGEPNALPPVDISGHNLAAPGTPFSTWIAGYGKAGFAMAWLVGTVLLLGWTLVRVWRFRRWLIRTSQPAPPPLLRQVGKIGRRLGLVRMPEVHTTAARVSPMVCWTGRTTRLVIPSFLLTTLSGQELRAVLAHELAHVRRRDHLVRWIEWLACSAFWWNPVAWWARRELRAAEETSCDALGVAAVKSTPRAYAESLLRVVELLSTPPTPPAPVFASGATSARSPKVFERRLRALMSGQSTDQTPRWTRATAAAAAACLLTSWTRVLQHRRPDTDSAGGAARAAAGGRDRDGRRTGTRRPGFAGCGAGEAVGRRSGIHLLDIRPHKRQCRPARPRRRAGATSGMPVGTGPGSARRSHGLVREGDLQRSAGNGEFRRPERVRDLGKQGQWLARNLRGLEARKTTPPAWQQHRQRFDGAHYGFRER